jgi:hypothetical protein
MEWTRECTFPLSCPNYFALRQCNYCVYVGRTRLRREEKGEALSAPDGLLKPRFSIRGDDANHHVHPSTRNVGVAGRDTPLLYR